MSGDERRWTLRGHDGYASGWFWTGDDAMLARGERVVVMPVAAHEAALAAARQVDDAMVERAAACIPSGGIPYHDGGASKRTIARAALLAALNAPEPEGER